MHLAIQHMGLSSIVVVDASKLQRNVPSPNDGQLLGKLRQFQNLV